MRLRLFALMATLCMACSMAANDSGFVREEAMMADLLQMLANFSSYAKDIYTDTDSIGYFKGNSAGKSNEDGAVSYTHLTLPTT